MAAASNFLTRLSRKSRRILGLEALRVKIAQAKQQKILREAVQRIRTFKDLHKGRRCFVIGSGPSLRIADLERLKNECTFASNKIYLCFNETNWRPTYYVAEDDRVITHSLEAINKMSGSTKLLRILPDVEYRNGSDLVRFEMITPSEADFPVFREDAAQGLACGYTVTYIALQWAFYMGFTQVYLLGVDFNYPGMRLCPDGTAEFAQPGTHFISGYGKPGEKFWAPNFAKNLQAYKLAKTVFERNGLAIYNATRGGKLEVFERVDFDQLF